jgi:hypothetical protein
MIFIFFISWQQVLSSVDEDVMIGLITIVLQKQQYLPIPTCPSHVFKDW